MPPPPLLSRQESRPASTTPGPGSPRSVDEYDRAEARVAADADDIEAHGSEFFGSPPSFYWQVGGGRYARY